MKEKRGLRRVSWQIPTLKDKNKKENKEEDVKIIIREVEGAGFGDPRKNAAWRSIKYSRKVNNIFKKADSEEWWEKKGNSV